MLYGQPVLNPSAFRSRRDLLLWLWEFLVISFRSKSISYTVWHVGIARAHVVLARGIHFTSMGHSASRPIRDSDDTEKYQKRLELLPEEAIYLIERGSVFCWKETDLDLSKIDSIEEINGVPMTVQQAYSVMIGKENLTLERFQVRRIPRYYLVMANTHKLYRFTLTSSDWAMLSLALSLQIQCIRSRHHDN